MSYGILFLDQYNRTKLEPGHFLAFYKKKMTYKEQRKVKVKLRNWSFIVNDELIKSIY